MWQTPAPGGVLELGYGMWQIAYTTPLMLKTLRRPHNSKNGFGVCKLRKWTMCVIAHSNHFKASQFGERIWSRKMNVMKLWYSLSCIPLEIFYFADVACDTFLAHPKMADRQETSTRRFPPPFHALYPPALGVAHRSGGARHRSPSAFIALDF